MAYTKCLITRQNWVLSSAATFSGGSWSSLLPLANLKTPQAQQVAQAASNSSANTRFDTDLGAIRKVGLIEFQRLVTTTSGTIRVLAGTDATFASNNYDSTVISSWPLDSSPWGDSATKYNATEYANLGYPRYFVPSAPIDCRYIRVLVVDTGASPPLQIGHFGAWETWEFTYNYQALSITHMDHADVQVTPYGSSYITPRYMNRQMRFSFNAIDASAGGDFLERVLQIGTMKGISDPLCLVPFPVGGNAIERTSIWGRFATPPEFVRTSWALWSADLTLEQLV